MDQNSVEIKYKVAIDKNGDMIIIVPNRVLQKEEPYMDKNKMKNLVFNQVVLYWMLRKKKIVEALLNKIDLTVLMDKVESELITSFKEVVVKKIINDSNSDDIKNIIKGSLIPRKELEEMKNNECGILTQEEIIDLLRFREDKNFEEGGVDN